MKLSPTATAVLLGTVIGGVLGAGAAWTYMRQNEASKAHLVATKGEPPLMNAGAGDFIKIGVALLALLRQFDDLFKPK